MKSIIYLFFLLVAGAASVCGQSAPPVILPAPPVILPALPAPPFLTPSLPPLSQGLSPTLQDLPSAPRLVPFSRHRVGIPSGSPLPQLNALRSQNPIRIMHPDNMPCLVPDLTRVERMPVRRMTNADRMLAVPHHP